MIGGQLILWLLGSAAVVLWAIAADETTTTNTTHRTKEN